MNKMRYGAIGAIAGMVLGVVLYLVLPGLLLRDAEINSQYYQSQYGNLGYPGGVWGSIFSQRVVVWLLGIVGFGVGYVVGIVRERMGKREIEKVGKYEIEER